MSPLAGCTSLDEKLITGVSSQYYSTPDGLNSAVVASYSQLRGYYGREQLLSLQQVGTDTWMAADQAGSNNKEFDSYSGGLNSTVAPLANTWNPAYQAINTLNAALDRGPSTTGISAAVKDSLLGEAHFLRALNYFTLVRQFGDVTLTLHENKGVVVTAARDSAAAVYRAIIADLDTAVQRAAGRRRRISAARRRAPRRRCGRKVYLTRAYQPYSPGKQADFTPALADAKAVINSGTYSLEPVFADLWCVARAGRSGPHRLLREHRLQAEPQGIHLHRAVPVRPARMYDGGQRVQLLHLVYLGQYDNNGIWVGTPRDLNNGRPFRRLMPTPYELSLWNKWIGTPGASDILDTRFDGSFQTSWIATAGDVRNATGELHVDGAVRELHEQRVINVGDTAAVYYTVYGVRQAHPAEQGVRDSHAVPDGCGGAARPPRRTAATGTTRTTATSTGSASRRSRSSRTTCARTSRRRKAARCSRSIVSARSI